jgi:hypothetical protein
MTHEDEDGYQGDAARGAPPARGVPIGIVLTRIVVVTGMGFSAAWAIFLLVAAIWVPAMIATGLTLIFLVLMFAIERGVE